MSDDPGASVEEAASTYLTTTAKIAVRRELASLTGALEPEEAPVIVSRAALYGRFGLIAVTDKRVVFLDKARLDSKSRSILMRDIGWVNSGTTPLGYGMLKIGPRRSDGKVLKFKVIPKSRAPDLQAAIEPFIDPIDPPPDAEAFEDESSNEQPRESPSAQIGKLHELHKAGLISDEEFKRREAEILSQVMEY